MRKPELVLLKKCQQIEINLRYNLNRKDSFVGLFFIVYAIMPKNRLSKDEFKVRVLKCKWDIDQEPSTVWQGEKNLAHKYLNKVLDIIDEYRY